MQPAIVSALCTCSTCQCRLWVLPPHMSLPVAMWRCTKEDAMLDHKDETIKTGQCSACCGRAGRPHRHRLCSAQQPLRQGPRCHSLRRRPEAHAPRWPHCSRARQPLLAPRRRRRPPGAERAVQASATSEGGSACCTPCMLACCPENKGNLFCIAALGENMIWKLVTLLYIVSIPLRDMTSPWRSGTGPVRVGSLCECCGG